MKCLKCLKVDPPLIMEPSKMTLPPLLAHLKDWCVCLDCTKHDKKMVAEKASIYYRANKKHYRKLHIKYKAEPALSYVKNMLADGRSIKAADIPDELAKVKGQQLKAKRKMKEIEDGEET